MIPVYSTPIVPLSYTRVTGMTVNVTVVDASSGAALLASTSVPEQNSSGTYTYQWTHGLIKDTLCLVTYTATNRQPVKEYIQISFEAGLPARGF